VRGDSLGAVGDVQPSSRPPALITSLVFGAIGAVLLLAGLATSSVPLVVGSSLAGTLSLIAVLVWRSQLIESWRERQAGDAGTE
jgi:hypothetical protein